MGWVVNDLPWLFYPREYPSTHCIRHWYGKSQHHQLIPSLSYWQQVAILTTLSPPTLFAVMCAKLFLKHISVQAQINIQIYCCSYITELYTVHYCTAAMHFISIVVHIILISYCCFLKSHTDNLQSAIK